MHARRRRYLRGSIALIVAALLAAGCGSSDSGSSDAGSDDSTPTSKPATGTPIKIGQISTITSPGNPTQTVARDALTAWVKWTNDHGGISGHPVELKTMDDHGNAGTGVAAAQQLLNSDKVIALLGSNAAQSDAAWAPDLQKAKVPVLGGVAYGIPWILNPDFYAVGPAQPTLLFGDFYEAKNLVKASKVGIMLCNTASVCDAAVPLFQNNAKALGLELTSIVKAGVTQPNYNAQCLALKQSGATAVLVAGPPVQQVAANCVQQGFSPRFFVVDGVGLYPSGVKKTAALEGVVSSLSGFPTSKQFPETKDFFTAMKRYFPAYFSDDAKHDQLIGGVAGPLAWTSGVALAKALENAGATADAAVSSADIIKGLSMFKGETLGGIAPPLTYGDGTAPNAGTKCWFVMTVKDRAYAAPKGLEVDCQT